MMCYEVLRTSNIVVLLFITATLVVQTADQKTQNMLKVFYVAVAIVLVVAAYSTIDLKLRGVPAAPRNLYQFIGYVLLLLATYREFLVPWAERTWQRFTRRVQERCHG